MGDQRGALLCSLAMLRLLNHLVSFLQEHRRCGGLESGIDDRWVWIVCECGARIVQPIPRLSDQSRSSEQ
jgi:hypothetical protein